VSHLQTILVFRKVQVKKYLLQKFNILLPVIFDQSGKNLPRYLLLLEFSTEDEWLKVFEESLLHAGFGKHQEELAEQVIEGIYSDAEFQSHS
jgi:hypothetical protein